MTTYTLFQQFPIPAHIRWADTAVMSNNFNQVWKPGDGTYWYGFHGGDDLHGYIGDSIYPVRTGVVYIVQSYRYNTDIGNAYGNRVCIRHDFTFGGKRYTRFSWNCHLNTVYVKKGQSIGLKTKLGTMGRTGTVTGPHDHFMWSQVPIITRSNARAVLIDPHPYLYNALQRARAA